MKKRLIDYKLDEEIDNEDAKIYFGKEIMDAFTLPVTLVGISWSIQGKDGTQMDYKLTTKEFKDKEEAKKTK